MRKGFIIIVLIAALTGGVLGYISKSNVKPISSQLDMKSGSTDINWVIGTSSYCDGICRNFSSSSSSSWGGGGSGGGGK